MNFFHSHHFALASRYPFFSESLNPANVSVYGSIWLTLVSYMEKTHTLRDSNCCWRKGNEKKSVITKQREEDLILLN